MDRRDESIHQLGHIGQSASALKERLHVFPPVPGQPIQCGILIYTAFGALGIDAGLSSTRPLGVPENAYKNQKGLYFQC